MSYEKRTEEHLYHAFALGVGGFLERDRKKQPIPIAAPNALSVSGGSGMSQQKGYEFTYRDSKRKGRDFSIAVRARVLTTDPVLLLSLARAGAGLAMLFEGQARDDVARGDLVPVLEEFSDPFSGFYLYYPQRRHASPALRALVEYLKAARKPGRRTKHARQDR